MGDYTCQFAAKTLDAEVVIPGSKSLTNRALVAAALADGTSLIDNLLLAEDTRLMLRALEVLGLGITVDESTCRAEITGCRGHLPTEEAELDCGNAGTVMRFCAAMTALGGGRFRLDGSPRMRERPIGGLVDALRWLGCGVEFHGHEGFPPFTIRAAGLRGGHVVFDSPESSQWISALLLAAPYAGGDVFIETKGVTPSVPYLRMTLAVMDRFGVPVLAEPSDMKGPARFIVEAPQRYQSTNLTIEPDATNASYFWAATAVAGGRVTVRGLGSDSVQGDAAFTRVLESMGCRVVTGATETTVIGPDRNTPLRAVDVDLNDMPDVAPTLAVLALFADGPTHIRNVANLRVKETDRLTALHRELAKLGADVAERPDGLTIHPPRNLRPARIDTYDDHRMAMSFALAGLRCPGLVIQEAQCCGKTFPGYFEKLERVAGGRS
jgi:3-phosphoshikimate 1-carboxyvinyltransferase